MSTATDKHDDFFLPAVDSAPPTTLGEFCGEVYSLANWLDDAQSSVTSEHQHIKPETIGAILFLPPRFGTVVGRFVDSLRRVHSSIPYLSGVPIRSFHEHVIDKGSECRRWLFLSLTPNDLYATQELSGHSRFERLGELAASRLRSRGWPFRAVDYSAVKEGLKSEADKMQQLHGKQEHE